MRSSQDPISGVKHSRPIIAGGLALVLSAVWVFFPGLPGRAEPPAAADAGQAPRANAPSNITVEANPQLFATMCALHAAGFEADVSAAGFHPLRARLRGELLRQRGPAAEALRAFYRDHLVGDPAATLSRYVSFALVVGPPPKFKYLLRRDELPPDVLPIEGFNEVLASFYREAQVERLWAQVEPEYNREIARLHGPVSELVLSSTAYLRELLRSDSPRTFAVYVEPLVGGTTNFRNYGDHYAIVASPGGELPRDEIRHALLHFLLDPLALRYRAVVAAKASLLGVAARAPQLPDEYREDFPSFLTECLVRAVELRLRRLPPEKLALAIEQAEGEGYVLVRTFSRGLQGFEKAEPAMRYYFRDLVSGIDVAEETKRLQSVQFAPATKSGQARAAAAQSGPAGRSPSEVDLWLEEGERRIAAQDAAAAAAAFQRVLAKEPEQPRALYGLAVAAVLQGEADRAKELFHRLVTSLSQRDAHAPAKDPVILAWSHVYLGRIYDVDGDRELAVSEYRAALTVEGAPETARLAAQRGIEKGYQPGSAKAAKP